MVRWAVTGSQGTQPASCSPVHSAAWAPRAQAPQGAQGFFPFSEADRQSVPFHFTFSPPPKKTQGMMYVLCVLSWLALPVCKALRGPEQCLGFPLHRSQKEPPVEPTGDSGSSARLRPQCRF